MPSEMLDLIDRSLPAMIYRVGSSEHLMQSASTAPQLSVQQPGSEPYTNRKLLIGFVGR